MHIQERERDTSEPFRNILAFYIFGFLSDFQYVVLLSAAESLLSSTDLPTGVVLVCDIGPLWLLKVFGSMYMEKLSYKTRVILISLSMVVSFQLIAWFDVVWVQLLGIGLTSLGAGLAEITFLALSAHYHHNTVSAFAAGTGLSCLLGPYTFIALHTWLSLSVRVSMLIMTPITLGFFVAYAWLLTNKASSNNKELAERHDYHYDYAHLDNDGKASHRHHRTLRYKLSRVYRLLPYIVPLFVTYFSEYLSNQGVVTTLAFPRSHFIAHSANDYEFYQAAFYTGEFLARSSANCWSLPHSKYLKYPAALQLLNLLVFLSAAYWRYMPNCLIIIALSLWMGLLAGFVYVNAFFLMAQEVAEEDREFSLGVGTIGDATGIFLASIVALFTEPALRRHCRATGHGRDACLSRNS